jgi:hypothetical protein
MGATSRYLLGSDKSDMGPVVASAEIPSRRLGLKRPTEELGRHRRPYSKVLSLLFHSSHSLLFVYWPGLLDSRSQSLPGTGPART